MMGIDFLSAFTLKRPKLCCIRHFATFFQAAIKVCGFSPKHFFLLTSRFVVCIQCVCLRHRLIIKEDRQPFPPVS
jgi:hypothetical protein